MQENVKKQRIFIISRTCVCIFMAHVYAYRHYLKVVVRCLFSNASERAIIIIPGNGT